MKRDLELEATIVEKFAAVEAVLDERGRRLWAAAEARAIGYGGDSVVCDASASTLNRLELSDPQEAAHSRYKRIAGKPEALDELLVELFVESYAKAPREIWLDLGFPGIEIADSGDCDQRIQ